MVQKHTQRNTFNIFERKSSTYVDWGGLTKNLKN